jgi:hypothetical protein
MDATSQVLRESSWLDQERSDVARESRYRRVARLRELARSLGLRGLRMRLKRSALTREIESCKLWHDMRPLVASGERSTQLPTSN